MPSIEFTTQLAEHVECPIRRQVDAAETLRDALGQLYAEYPRLRDYVTDEQGMIRQHISVFVDGEMLTHRDALDVPLSDRSEVFVMQAISGG
jgi:molybdopterin converting factor small subunit